MRLIKLIGPAAMIATLAVFAPHADAQTMGEYATTVGVASGGGSSMGSGDLGGGSRTWGASSLGASFAERAGAASSSGGGSDFASRAGSLTGGSESASRWPESHFSGGGASERFGGASDRFQNNEDRFKERPDLSGSSDRFPASSFNDNKMGLDTHFSSSSGLDKSYSSN
jgi:hypothetical protein